MAQLDQDLFDHKPPHGPIQNLARHEPLPNPFEHESPSMGPLLELALQRLLGMGPWLRLAKHFSIVKISQAWVT